MDSKLKTSDLDAISTIIEDRVSYFNGWRVSEEKAMSSCKSAAREIIDYLQLSIDASKEDSKLCEKHGKFPCRECGTKHYDACQCEFCRD